VLDGRNPIFTAQSPAHLTLRPHLSQGLVARSPVQNLDSKIDIWHLDTSRKGLFLITNRTFLAKVSRISKTGIGMALLSEA
jgi:hypothetical protein